MLIDAEGVGYRELNSRIRGAVANGRRSFRLVNVRGQRYIGAGLPAGVEISIEGVPGNDLACFMAGARVIVEGNAQDGVGNTMESGSVVVKGTVGDLPGYAMRGGRIFVAGNAGYRVGIHMKEFRESVPAIVVGGRVEEYLGEYMAGGTIVVLGLPGLAGKPAESAFGPANAGTGLPGLAGKPAESAFGPANAGTGLPGLAGKPAEFIGTGMHGGEIWIRGKVAPWQLGAEVGAVEPDPPSWARISALLADFTRETGMDCARFGRGEFTRLRPVSLRPYGRIYVY
jgi:glutamate synthase domain-containing protein 3